MYCSSVVVTIEAARVFDATGAPAGPADAFPVQTVRQRSGTHPTYQVGAVLVEAVLVEDVLVGAVLAGASEPETAVSMNGSPAAGAPGTRALARSPAVTTCARSASSTCCPGGSGFS